MHAIVCHGLTGAKDLTWEETELYPLSGGDVRIRVEACGVNFADALIVEGKYQEKTMTPFTPGIEVAGVVEAIAEDVTSCKVGDRVLAVVPQGGFAESVNAPEMATFLLPQDIDFATAAALPVSYGTAHAGLKWRAQLRAGETLLVLGAAGGAGLAAVEIGKAMGAQVIAAASSQEKLDIAQQHGADHLINYKEEDLRKRVKALTNGQGADVIFDPVGGSAFDTALRCINWEGRLVVIGFASGTIPQVPANLLLVKNISVVGLYWGAYLMRNPAAMREQIQELFSWTQEKSFLLLSQKLFQSPKQHKPFKNSFPAKLREKSC